MHVGQLEMLEVFEALHYGVLYKYSVVLALKTPGYIPNRLNALKKQTLHQ